MTMAWGWIVKMLATRSQGMGLFGYLASMDHNKTRVRLEKARQEATKDIIDHLAGGGVYREGTPEGWREILIPQVPQSPIFVAPIEQPDSPAGLCGPTGLPQSPEALDRPEDPAS